MTIFSLTTSGRSKATIDGGLTNLLVEHREKVIIEGVCFLFIKCDTVRLESNTLQNITPSSQASIRCLKISELLVYPYSQIKLFS